MKRRIILPIVGLVLALTIAFGIRIVVDGRDVDSDVPILPVTTTTEVQLPTTVPQDPPYADLAAVLPTELDGYRVDTNARATGSLDLDEAVSAESDVAAERALLETRDFEAGYARAFTDDTTDVYMVVYDFGSSENASLYLADGFITLYGKGANTYDVETIAGARGFSQGVEVDGRPAIVHGVAFSKADRFVLVFTRSASSSTPADAAMLAGELQIKA